MNELIEKIQNWFKMRGPRERIYLFVLGLVVMYLLCFVVLIKTLSAQKKQLKAKIIALDLQKNSYIKEIGVLKTLLKDQSFIKKLDEEKAISSNMHIAEEKLKHLKPILASTAELPILTKTILNHTGYNYTLINLKDLPSHPWVLDVSSKQDITFETNGIFENGFVIEIKSDYFATIQYLTWLEKLPYHLYWDSLEYKVLEYPTADVLISLRALTYQKS